MAVVRSFNSYDVFLNFRGADTRKTFTNKLYMALVQQGLSTFRDEDTMNKGENLKSELEKAIRKSKSSIVVISKDYASSTWCLDELVLILEQRKTSRHAVLPVFYDVDPSHVRKQSGRIAEAFARYEEQLKAETNCRRKRVLTKKIKRWRSALTEVGFLNGLDFQNHVNGHESKFIKKIIKIISDKLIQLTVVLKISLHSEGCISKITRIISMTNGVENFTVDPRKDLVTVEGRMDIKKLVLYLEEKLKQGVQGISIVKKDDKGGQNKEKKGDKENKNNAGDKKEEESDSGDDQKEKTIEYFGYNPNTYTIPVDHQSDKKEKESSGEGGKKENKSKYVTYYFDTCSVLMHYQSGDGGDKMVNKTEYYEYYPSTHMMPMYDYAAHRQYYSDHCCTGAHCHSPSEGGPSYYHHAMLSDDSLNWCSLM
ncbi:hypothetical protein LguiB_021421 [Lonicera macranthoides]